VLLVDVQVPNLASVAARERLDDLAVEEAVDHGVFDAHRDDPADGVGVVSHAGVGPLREMATQTGLVAGISAALIDTYPEVPLHAPGRVFTDLAVAIADGADAVSGIRALGDREDLFGALASMPTTWRSRSHQRSGGPRRRRGSPNPLRSRVAAITGAASGCWRRRSTR
jgi:hypothetical protein